MQCHDSRRLVMNVGYKQEQENEDIGALRENTESARVGCVVKHRRHMAATIQFAECNAKFFTTSCNVVCNILFTHKTPVLRPKVVKCCLIGWATLKNPLISWRFIVVAVVTLYESFALKV